jgi:hypothetical protein
MRPLVNVLWNPLRVVEEELQEPVVVASISTSVGVGEAASHKVGDDGQPKST